MVKGKGEPCLSAVVQCRAERRPDRPADKEDTYGGYDMHFSLYTTLCPLQNVIPMLQIGFSGALRQLRIHILRYPGIETAGKTLRAAPYISALLSFAPQPCRERIYPFRLPRFCRNPPVGQQKNVSVQIGCASKKGRAMLAPTIIDFSADKVGTCGTGKPVPLLEVFRSLP